MVDMSEHIEDWEARGVRADAFRRECQEAVTNEDRERLAEIGIDPLAYAPSKFRATPWSPFKLHNGCQAVLDDLGNVIMLSPH